MPLVRKNREGILQPKEEKAQIVSCLVDIICMMGVYEHINLDSSHWDPVNEQGAMGKNWNTINSF